MKNVQKFSFDSLRELLDNHDSMPLYREKAQVPEENDLYEQLSNSIKFKDFTDKTVLGIDIYQYSQYRSLEQSIVPFLFKLIYKETVELCMEKANFIFQKYEKDDFKKQFIDSGDGGFQLFQTPLHAIIFAIHFELFVRYYNAYQFYPKLRKLIGPLNLRYALTNDLVFEFEGNFYGPCIINNNRILSKDELNRFLIDENTYNWFMLHMSGLENLQILSIEEILRMKGFEDYKVTDEMETIFPMAMDFIKKGSIVSVDVQKIGKIEVKSANLSIYNLHIQYLGGITHKEDLSQRTVITLSLGNLNTSGIQ
jgi:hypothetical protein